MQEPSLVQRSQDSLNYQWQYLSDNSEAISVKSFGLSKEDVNEIQQILNSSTKSYHYVLPTQLLVKLIDSKLDCRSLQMAFNSDGAFDARTIAHKVIVPFDKANYNVLGGSNEPYVNNPLRYPAIIAEYRNQQKNQKDWDLLVKILGRIQAMDSSEFTINYFRSVLYQIYLKLADVQVTYPTPSRISMANTVKLISDFSNEKSGGDILETLTSALFQAIGTEFNLFDEVKRSKVNASDASTGLSSDIECWSNNTIVLTVEVKDKTLNLTQFKNTIESARTNKITEILFIAEKGIIEKEKTELKDRVNKEFNSGQNVYIENFYSFATGILVLLGEAGRVKYLNNIGPELDRVNSNILLRKKWAELLSKI
ncbi:MAG: restriction endonuclease, SacI family [Ekhidna sp.]|nr:restriction endonuclease, SacI family [Ekhidna sp.]